MRVDVGARGISALLDSAIARMVGTGVGMLYPCVNGALCFKGPGQDVQSGERGGERQTISVHFTKDEIRINNITDYILALISIGTGDGTDVYTLKQRLRLVD